MQYALKDMNEQGRDNNSNSEQSCSVKYVVDQPKLYKLQKMRDAVTFSQAMHLLHSMLSPLPWHRMTLISAKVSIWWRHTKEHN